MLLQSRQKTEFNVLDSQNPLTEVLFDPVHHSEQLNTFMITQNKAVTDGCLIPCIIKATLLVDTSETYRASEIVFSKVA